jgi:hypothetical protein
MDVLRFPTSGEVGLRIFAVAFLADTRGMCPIIPQKYFFAYNRFSTFRWYYFIVLFPKPITFKEIPMRKMFGFMIGIMVGSLVGSTIALLLAPESGEILRSELRDRGESFVGEVRHAADSRRIELKDRLDTLRAPRG